MFDKEKWQQVHDFEGIEIEGHWTFCSRVNGSWDITLWPSRTQCKIDSSGSSLDTIYELTVYDATFAVLH